MDIGSRLPDTADAGQGEDHVAKRTVMVYENIFPGSLEHYGAFNAGDYRNVSQRPFRSIWFGLKNFLYDIFAVSSI